MTISPITIRDYEASDQRWFDSLNREWIERHFQVEPVDEEVLSNPDAHILKKGGFVLMALYGEEVAGTCALRYVGTNVYEFTKMAVAPDHRNKGIGKALVRAALRVATSIRATKIILYSNAKLQPAIALYRTFGFQEVPLDGPYKRSDIKMELPLHDIPTEVTINVE